MEDISNTAVQQEDASVDFINAEQLLELTISQEERFERDRKNVLTNLLDGCLHQAQTFGATNFSASLNPQFDPKLLVEVAGSLKGLGYNVNSRQQNDEKIGVYSVLDISWAKQPVEVVQEAVIQETAQETSEGQTSEQQ